MQDQNIADTHAFLRGFPARILIEYDRARRAGQINRLSAMVYEQNFRLCLDRLDALAGEQGAAGAAMTPFMEKTESARRALRGYIDSVARECKK